VASAAFFMELYPRPALLKVIPDPERKHCSNAAERAKHDSPSELFHSIAPPDLHFVDGNSYERQATEL
jgi:hypothetical protein